jgi:hypothetical protein
VLLQYWRKETTFFEGRKEGRKKDRKKDVSENVAVWSPL